VTGPGGSDTLTRQDYITVYAPVVAGFAAVPTEGPAPLAVAFTNSSTGDYDQSFWDFGDGFTSGDTDPIHSYTVPGSYTVSLTVSGPGGSDTLTRVGYITVYTPVVAGFTAAPTEGPAPLIVAFTNTSTGDYDQSFWDFGDGFTSGDTDPIHTYTAPGSYAVSLTVTGPGGSDALTREGYITVYTPVDASFTGTPRAGLRPLTVAFTNTSTGDYTSSSWSFGDGGTSALTNPNYTYTTAGKYTVSLTVSGPGGTDTVTSTNYITVLAGKAHVSGITLSYVFQSGKYTITARLRIVNQNNQPVSAATVSAQWTLPNSARKNQQAQTNTSGVATFYMQSALTGVYKICVLNVTKTNWFYDSAQNVETCDQITVP
jgi:PKD repeat protein